MPLEPFRSVGLLLGRRLAYLTRSPDWPLLDFIVELVALSDHRESCPRGHLRQGCPYLFDTFIADAVGQTLLTRPTLSATTIDHMQQQRLHYHHYALVTVKK